MAVAVAANTPGAMNSAAAAPPSVEPSKVQATRRWSAICRSSAMRSSLSLSGGADSGVTSSPASPVSPVARAHATGRWAALCKSCNETPFGASSGLPSSPQQGSRARYLASRAAAATIVASRTAQAVVEGTVPISNTRPSITF
eukprot:CAMPEP_0172589232 /NCGR_PEP_ID=MMETSP1068-20121228/8017_1 /TAXON_ID=35684 /ORGANISM="Pseudopedinella elastica, Strain CCMP716" /LENGTH=142 /DNA_ID=CAMNT_0013384783 /DNA_START=102 /DNA_END=530 /DNA_ORIENTATION=+